MMFVATRTFVDQDGDLIEHGKTFVAREADVFRAFPECFKPADRDLRGSITRFGGASTLTKRRPPRRPATKRPSWQLGSTPLDYRDVELRLRGFVDYSVSLGSENKKDILAEVTRAHQAAGEAVEAAGWLFSQYRPRADHDSTSIALITRSIERSGTRGEVYLSDPHRRSRQFGARATNTWSSSAIGTHIVSAARSYPACKTPEPGPERWTGSGVRHTSRCWSHHHRKWAGRVPSSVHGLPVVTARPRGRSSGGRVCRGAQLAPVEARVRDRSRERVLSVETFRPPQRSAWPGGLERASRRLRGVPLRSEPSLSRRACRRCRPFGRPAAARRPRLSALRPRSTSDGSGSRS